MTTDEPQVSTPEEMVWEEPRPSRKRSRTRVDEVVEILRAHPGRWALVDRNCSSSNQLTWRAHGCEISLRGTHQRLLYARWPIRPEDVLIRAVWEQVAVAPGSSAHAIRRLIIDSGVLPDASEGRIRGVAALDGGR